MRASWWLAIAFGVMARPAFAGDAAAEALFRAGREASEQGDFATACARFEESRRLEPAPGTVFNLAVCYERLGQVASAWQRFQEVKERLPAADERVALADERIAALASRLPKLTLRLADAPAGATALRDGVPLGSASLGIAVPVDPGRHELVARAPGHADSTVSVEIAEGERKEVVLRLGAPETASAATSSQSSTSSASASSSPVLGYTLGAIGVAGIATSLITGALVLDRKSTVEKECVGSVCSRAGADAASSGRTLSAVSTVAFAAGAVCTAAGLYFILSSDSQKKETARLELSALPGSASLRVGGTF